LRRLFSTFPGGLPGLGLLLLRAAIGAKLMFYTFVWITQPQNSTLRVWALSSLILTAGLSFVFGLLTPLAGAFLSAAGISFYLWHPAWDPFLVSLLSFDSIVMALAVSFLGPGAFSLDARFFGRRRIIIPHH
jgi:hypothetical protein